MSISSNGFGSASAQMQQAGVYTDLNSLQKIKQLPRGGENGESEEALRAIAEQFESIFVNMMMKSMRDSNAVFEEGSMLGSSEQKFYRDMFDQQLSLTLSEGKGIGLADVLVRQLSKSLGSSSSEVNNLDKTVTMPEVGALNAVDKAHLKVPAFDSPQAFAEHLYPKAKPIADKMGVNPRYLVSQAALETGWGQHMITKPDGSSSFNLFGIKADARWQGDIANVQTLEYRDGVARREQASFRAYSSFEESLEDYLNFLSANDRYQKALSVAGDNPEQFLQELQQAGYATDPAYAKKISDISKRNIFAELEAVSSGNGPA